MKFLIILSLLAQFLVTNLSADLAYEEYMRQKEKAYNLYDNGDKEGAIASVKSFIRKHPKDLRAQNLLAVLYFWSGEVQKAKTISLNILKKEDFKPSRTLLKSISQNEGSLSFSKLPEIKKSKTPNLLTLIQNVKKDPQDIMSRKILALHYEKIGNFKQASYFANEVLKINPDDSDMIALVKDENENIYASKSKVDKAIDKLNYFYKVKNYTSFMNLYRSLEHNNVVLPTPIHVSALDVAIELQEYQKAKSILHIYRMPKSKYLSQLKRLIDEKLLLSRFAVNTTHCTGTSCPSGR